MVVEDIAGTGGPLVSGVVFPLWRGGGGLAAFGGGGGIGVVAKYFEY